MLWEFKWNENKTALHLKVTRVIQQIISSNINKLTLKKIKRTSEEMPENKKVLFCFFKPLSRPIQKKINLCCEQTENALKERK